MAFVSAMVMEQECETDMRMLVAGVPVVLLASVPSPRSFQRDATQSTPPCAA